MGVQEAKAALAMEGMSVMGSTLRVELTRSAVNASANLPRDSSAPFAAMQAHQLAQLQLVWPYPPALLHVHMRVCVCV